MDMEQRHTNTLITTFLTDFCKDISGRMMDSLLHGENPKEIWVECEVHDVDEGGDAID